MPGFDQVSSASRMRLRVVRGTHSGLNTATTQHHAKAKKVSKRKDAVDPL